MLSMISMHKCIRYSMVRDLTDEESSETSMPVKLRQIFRAGLVGVSIIDDLCFLAAGEPIAFG
jgi:hypothetical protein